MTSMADLFTPGNLFSQDNPLLKSAGKAHRLVFETFDQVAHVQIDFVGDLLELNRKRFDALYANENLLDKVSTQQSVATEIGKRTARWAGDLSEVAVNFQSRIGATSQSCS